MKIIQSYWSLPSDSSDKDVDGRSNGGFLDARFNYMSWALSCLCLKRFYKDVELVTDEKGKKLLIDTLKLPYTKVTVCLDELNHYNPKLWAIGKIKAYQLQKEPFLHVDGDVYIWEEFDKKQFATQKLMVQNIEKDYDYYKEVLKYLNEEFVYFPDSVKENYFIKGDLTAVNAGIMGGSDIDFFQEYTNAAFEFVNRNSDQLNNINVGMFNCIYEQYLFYSMAKHKNIPVTPFLDLMPLSEFVELRTFNLVPFEKKYIHLIGQAKNNIYACEQVEMRLRYEFPEYYQKINSLFSKAYFPNADKRFEQLKTIYSFLQTADINEILEVQLQLSENSKLIVRDNVNYLEYTNHQTNLLETLELKDWNMLLEAYNEPINGNEVLKILATNKESQEVKRLKAYLIDFITDKLVYSDILKFAKDIC